MTTINLNTVLKSLDDDKKAIIKEVLSDYTGARIYIAKNGGLEAKERVISYTVNRLAEGEPRAKVRDEITHLFNVSRTTAQRIVSAAINRMTINENSTGTN